MNKFVYAANVQ